MPVFSAEPQSSLDILPHCADCTPVIFLQLSAFGTARVETPTLLIHFYLFYGKFVLFCLCLPTDLIKDFTSTYKLSCIITGT